MTLAAQISRRVLYFAPLHLQHFVCVGYGIKSGALDEQYLCTWRWCDSFQMSLTVHAEVPMREELHARLGFAADRPLFRTQNAITLGRERAHDPGASLAKLWFVTVLVAVLLAFVCSPLFTYTNHRNAPAATAQCACRVKTPTG